MDHEGVINNIDTGTDDVDADFENNGWNDPGDEIPVSLGLFCGF